MERRLALHRLSLRHLPLQPSGSLPELIICLHIRSAPCIHTGNMKLTSYGWVHFTDLTKKTSGPTQPLPGLILTLPTSAGLDRPQLHKYTAGVAHGTSVV